MRGAENPARPSQAALSTSGFTRSLLTVEARVGEQIEWLLSTSAKWTLFLAHIYGSAAHATRLPLTISAKVAGSNTSTLSPQA